jgi:hypothetical protein
MVDPDQRWSLSRGENSKMKERIFLTLLHLIGRRDRFRESWSRCKGKLVPILLQPTDITLELEQFDSVLIVSCPVCPAASLAIAQDKPLFDFFKFGFKTEALENHIKCIQTELERRGIRTDAFTIRIPHPLMCLWTARQRDRLLKRASGFEAVLVLGCQSAAMTAKDALRDTACKVIPGMREVGLTNATVRFRSPSQIELDVHPLPQDPFNHRRDSAMGRGKVTERSM